MKKTFFLYIILVLLLPVRALASCGNLLDYSQSPLRSGPAINLCDAYAGKVLLIVNTASRCGFTSQFKQLEALYQKYDDQGLVILGFPSNDFNQEEADSKDIAEVCYSNYGVTFPMFSASHVRGKDKTALFDHLTALSDTEVQWNFYKYLVSRDGRQVQGFNSAAAPLGGLLEEQVRSALQQP